MGKNSTLDELLNKSLQDIEFKKEYEKDCADLENSVAMMKARKISGRTHKLN